MIEFSSFSHLVHCIVEWLGYVFLGRSMGWDSPLYFAFPHLYHLSSFENHLVSDILIWSGSSVSFSLSFRHHLSNTETTEAASLLSLLEECNFREGKRNVRVWKPNPVDGFSCKSFFRLLLDPSPVNESIFDDRLWMIKISKKIKFFTW